MITSIPQIAVQPAPAKTSASAPASHDSFSRIMEQMGGADSNHASAKSAAGSEHSSSVPPDTKGIPANSSAKAADRSGKSKSDKTEETNHPKDADTSGVIPDALASQVLSQASMPICLTPSLSVEEKSDSDGKPDSVATVDAVPNTPANSSESLASAKVSIPQFFADVFPDAAKPQDKKAIEDSAAKVGAVEDEAAAGTSKEMIVGQDSKKVGAEEKQAPLPPKSNDKAIALPTQDTIQAKNDAAITPASDQKNSVGQHGQHIKIDESAAQPVSQGDGNSAQGDAASAAATAVATIKLPTSSISGENADQTKLDDLKAQGTNKISTKSADTTLAADLSVAHKPGEPVAPKQESKQQSDKQGEKGGSFSAPSSDIQPAPAADAQAIHSASTVQAIHAATSGDQTKQHATQEATQASATRDTIQPRVTETAVPIGTPEAGAVLHSAKLLERMGQSELRLGIQGAEFGNIDIRTSMSHDKLTAEISVEHADLGRALAAELPSLQNKLAEHRISPASLVLQTQTDSSSSGHSSADWQRPRPTQNSGNTFTLENHVDRWHSETNVSSAGLDVHI